MWGDYGAELTEPQATKESERIAGPPTPWNRIVPLCAAVARDAPVVGAVTPHQ
jgi:hypothetical protein